VIQHKTSEKAVTVKTNFQNLSNMDPPAIPRENYVPHIQTRPNKAHKRRLLYVDKRNSTNL